MTLEERLTAIFQAIGTDVKTLTANQGNLASLTTTQKTSLVNAINELKAAQASASGINDAAASSSSTYSSTKIDTQIAAAISNIIGGASAAYDTLKELQDLIGADQTNISGILTALGNRVRVDAAQGFTTGQQAQARDNIGAQSAAAIGNPDADLVAIYTTAKA